MSSQVGQAAESGIEQKISCRRAIEQKISCRRAIEHKISCRRAIAKVSHWLVLWFVVRLR